MLNVFESIIVSVDKHLTLPVRTQIAFNDDLNNKKSYKKTYMYFVLFSTGISGVLQVAANDTRNRRRCPFLYAHE